MFCSNLKKTALMAACSAFAVFMPVSCDDNIPQESFQTGRHDNSGKVLCSFKAVHPVLDAPGADNTWPVSAQVGIFDNVIGSTGKASYVVNGNVSGEISADATKIAAIYPYDADASYSAAEGSITSTLPSSQNAVAESFGSLPNLSMAQTDKIGGDLEFQRAAAVLSFKIEDEGVASVSFEGQAGETLAGKVRIRQDGKGAICEKISGEGSNTLTVHGDGANGLFTKGKTYYAEVIPQTLAPGLKVTLAQDNGALGSLTIVSGAKLSTGSIFDLGSLHCEGYFSPYDQHHIYTTTGSITIAGKTYTYPDMPAYLVEDASSLKDIISGSDKRGIYFLNSGVDYNVVGVEISSEIVLVGRYSNTRSKMTYATNAYMYMYGGSLTIANMEFNNGARVSPWIGHNSKTGLADSFVIDNCVISTVTAPLWYITAYAFGIKEISITNSKIIVGPNGKNQLLNLWNSKSLTSFEKFNFCNNIIYAETPQDLQLFNGNGLNSSSKPDSKNTLLNMDVVVDNNIFYNLSSKTASPGLSGLIIRTYAVKSMHVSGNIFAHSQQSTIPNYPFFYLYGNQSPATISGYVFYDDEQTGDNFVWDMKGNGVANANATKVLFSAGLFRNSTDHADQNPFSSIDLSTGTFELTPEAAKKYGPRNQ